MLAFVLIALTLASAPVPVRSSCCVTPIAHVLWMHPETPGASGNEFWYNLTLTLNETVPLTDLLFLLYSPANAVYTPPTGSLSVIRGTTLVAAYNLTGRNWASGMPGELLNGDWFEVQVSTWDLAGYRLAAIGQGPFSSVSSVEFP